MERAEAISRARVGAQKLWAGTVEIVDAVLQSEKSIRGEPVESCKLRYFNSFEFFDHTPFEHRQRVA